VIVIPEIILLLVIITFTWSQFDTHCLGVVVEKEEEYTEQAALNFSRLQVALDFLSLKKTPVEVETIYLIYNLTTCTFVHVKDVDLFIC